CETPTGIPCCQSGSPGFKSSGQTHAFIPPEIETIQNSTPEACCKACFDDPACIEWLFAPNINECLLNKNKDTCNNPTMINIGGSSVFSQGGIMRCDADGCLKSN
ncbi:29782_t:CDS:1, partial [Racocetra persica]